MDFLMDLNTVLVEEIECAHAKEASKAIFK